VKDIPSDQLLTLKQVARLLNVSPSWVAREVRTGKLKAMRIGGTKRKISRFDPDYIRAFISKANTAQGEASSFAS